jgi:hypothetical protein
VLYPQENLLWKGIAQFGLGLGSAGEACIELGAVAVYHPV